MSTPMETADDIDSMWAADCIIDKTQLEDEILKIGEIHAKYLGIFLRHKKAVNDLDKSYKTMKNLRIRYYTCQIDIEDLKRLQWEPYEILENKNKVGMIPKDQLDKLLETDEYLVDILLEKAYHDDIIKACEYIFRELNNRSWEMRASMDFRKYMSGI